MAEPLSAQVGQWDAVIPVSSASGNYRPRIGLVRNGSPVVCWGNQSNGNVMFARYSNGAFQTSVALNPAGTSAYIQDWTGPEMAVKGDTIYVVFKMTPESSAGIYLVRSVDAGVTFSDTIRIDPPNGNIAWLPSVSVNRNGDPVVVYMDNDAGWVDPRYVTTLGSNLGNTFAPPVEATKNIAPGEVCDCCPASLLIKDSLQMVLFRNNQNNLRTIFASRSTDYGDSYISSDAVDITGSVSSQCQSTGPDGVFHNDSMYTVWRGNAGGLRIYISSTGLNSIAPVVHKKASPAIPSSSVQNYPKIAMEGNISVLTWQETYLANAEVLFSFDTIGNPANLGINRDTVNVVHTGGQINPDIAIVNRQAHIVWQDLASGNVLYRKRNFTSGVTSVREVNMNVLTGPNPFNDFINVQAGKDNLDFEVTDISGKIVLKGKSNSRNYVLNTSTLPSGSYIMRIDDGSSFQTIPLIKGYTTK